MLACYLDDSGTHIGSRALVWGGLIGHVDFFAELESAWRKALRSPCDGRPPIEAFHSSHLAASSGEFEGYSAAERDLTRYNFRKAIVDSGVTAVVYAVSVEGWAETFTGRVRQFVGDPERWICGEAIATGCDLAREHSMPISFLFDSERKSSGVEVLIRVATEDANEKGVIANVGFAPVNATPCLQAADMVAHQAYQHFLRRIADENAKPDAHMLRLMEDAYDWGVKVFTPHVMSEMERHITPLLEQMDEEIRKVLRGEIP